MRNIEVVSEHITEYALEAKMKEQKVSIRQLADRANVHYTFISRLLSGKARCTPTIYNKLRDALNDPIPNPTRTCK